MLFLIVGMSFGHPYNLFATCMKKILVTISLLVLSVASFAQTDTAARKWSYRFHGFVNPVAWVDSRQVVAGREGMMHFYPAPVVNDANGNDINAEPSLNMLAITARVNLAVQGPDVLGAHVLGFIEGDFTGPTDATINTLRLRHAYLKMQWQKQSLLAGQYWYPMVIHEIMPMTQPLNMGAPFHPYARYNQVRYTANLGNWEAVAVAAFQLDNKSKGPNGGSTEYITRSMVPEMNVQLRYKGERLFAGVAANLLSIRPRTLDLLGNKVDTRYNSASFSVFGKYNFGTWTLKAQTLLSDNLYEGCTMGGYLEDIDVINNAYSYKPFTWTTAWVDISRNSGKWRPALFLGYGINNNFGDIYASSETAYGRGFDMQSLWRVQPRINYIAGHGLSFMFDVEVTNAQYGAKVIDSPTTYHYETDANNNPTNVRLILGAQYDFLNLHGQKTSYGKVKIVNLF